MSLQTINTPRDTTFQSTETTPRNIADVLADELSGIAQALGGSTDYDNLSHRPQINSVTLTGNKSADDLSLAMQEDLTSIKATGTTNATGSTITSGTYFYLNGTLCQAKSDIANGATFTLNTNYEVVTAGGLNSLNSALAEISNTEYNLTLNSSYFNSLQLKAVKVKKSLIINAVFLCSVAPPASPSVIGTIVKGTSETVSLQQAKYAIAKALRSSNDAFININTNGNITALTAYNFAANTWYTFDIIVDLT